MDNKKREEFVKEYFKSHLENSEHRLKMVLDTCNEEPLLFRYRSMTDEDFHALEKNSFWQWTLNKQNDKEEGLVYLTYGVLKHSSISALKMLYNSFSVVKAKQIIGEGNIKLKNELKKFREPYGVVCFSELCDSHEMWVNYAHNYEGVCIAYSKEKLVYNRFHLVPVLYKNKKLITDYFSICVDSSGEIVINTIDGQTEKVLITKTGNWDYEREWRHIDWLNAREGDYLTSVIPEKIYIGYNCPLAKKEKIVEYCNKNNVEYVMQNNLKRNVEYADK